MSATDMEIECEKAGKQIKAKEFKIVFCCTPGPSIFSCTCYRSSTIKASGVAVNALPALKNIWHNTNERKDNSLISE